MLMQRQPAGGFARFGAEVTTDKRQQRSGRFEREGEAGQPPGPRRIWRKPAAVARRIGGRRERIQTMAVPTGWAPSLPPINPGGRAPHAVLLDLVPSIPGRPASLSTLGKLSTATSRTMDVYISEEYVAQRRAERRAARNAAAAAAAARCAEEEKARRADSGEQQKRWALGDKGEKKRPAADGNARAKNRPGAGGGAWLVGEDAVLSYFSA
ncbi:hypothetical protein BS78_01G183600 [Paspalum vaginatum]|nr:hypothetical protein BS78_01G183600 [Paspalum vaginatum]